MRAGVLAEYDTPERLLAAVGALRARGFTQLDTFTPYPIHGLEQALGLRRSILTKLVFPFSVTGVLVGYGIQWYCNARSYPINVGGRPPNAFPAFIPITFETMVIFTGTAALLLLFVLSRLPELWHPVMDVEGFQRATRDRFWIGVDLLDPKFDKTRIETLLRDELGAMRVERFGIWPEQ